MSEKKTNLHTSLLYLLLLLLLATLSGISILAFRFYQKADSFQKQLLDQQETFSRLQDEHQKEKELLEQYQPFLTQLQELDETQLTLLEKNLSLLLYPEDVLSDSLMVPSDTKEPLPDPEKDLPDSEQDNIVSVKDPEKDLPDFLPEEPLEEVAGTSVSISAEMIASIQTLSRQLQSSLPSDNGSWSVYVAHAESGVSTALNSQPMQAASLIKLFIMGAVYENYEELSDSYGAQALDDLLTPMITVSDNDAANTLVSYLGAGDSAAGMKKVNAFCRHHGYYDTSMGRLLLQSKENGDNYTSVSDCGRFLAAIYSGAEKKESVFLSHTDSMYELLKKQTRKNKIPARLPDGISVANKTGELSDVENDAGIIYHAPGNDLILCFMSENLNAPGNAQNKIAELSRLIYDHFNR